MSDDFIQQDIDSKRQSAQIRIEKLDGTIEVWPVDPMKARQEELIRARRIEYLMVDARKEGEDEITVFGLPVSTLEKEQLLAVIYRLHRELVTLRDRK